MGLENITNFLSRTARKVAMPVVAATGILTGCNASNYREIRKEEVPFHEQYMNWEYGTASTKDIAKKVLESRPASSATLPTLSKEFTDLVNKECPTSTPEGAAYVQLMNQNTAIAELLDSAKLRRVILHDAAKNADFEAFEQYGEANVENLTAALKNFDSLIDQPSYEMRQTLVEKLASNSDFEKILLFNEENLAALKQIYTAISDIDVIEGRWNPVYDASNSAAKITKALTGQDQYAQGKETLDKIFSVKIKECGFSQKSGFMGEFEGEEMTVGEAYNKLIKEIDKEVESWDDESLHTISNGPAAKMLEMVKETYMHQKDGKMTNEQFQSAIRYVIRDIATKELNGERVSRITVPERGFNLFRDVVFPIVPGYSIYAMLANGRAALSQEKYHAEVQK